MLSDDVSGKGRFLLHKIPSACFCSCRGSLRKCHTSLLENELTQNCESFQWPLGTAHNLILKPWCDEELEHNAPCGHCLLVFFENAITKSASCDFLCARKVKFRRAS